MNANAKLRANLVLASRFENIEVAERALVDLCHRAGCADDQEYWLVTALREAVANAVPTFRTQPIPRICCVPADGVSSTCDSS